MFVIPAKIIKIEDYDIYDCAEPGDIKFYAEDYFIEGHYCKYIVNQDFSYKNKGIVSFNQKEPLYGTYQKIEKYESDLYKGIIFTLGLYSYLPR